MNEFIVLDVAHGSTSLLISENETAVFDAAPKNVLLEVLDQYKITTIDYLFLSHSDQDHVGGVVPLLTSNKITVRNIFINADVSKGPQFNKLRVSIDHAVNTKGLLIHQLSTGTPTQNVGEVSINVLAPSVSDILGAAGGLDTNGNPIDSNSCSAVLSIKHDQHPIALLAADIDQRSLSQILESGRSLRADLLVFPHHGGNCANTSSQNVSFTKQLIAEVLPRVTIFSLGREKHLNPRQEIVSAIKSALPGVYIMCTQLSKNCLLNLPSDRSNWQGHLNQLPGSGKADIISCSGSLRIFLDGSRTAYPTVSGSHSSFVSINIPDAICLK